MPEFVYPDLLRTVYNRNARTYAAALLQVDHGAVSSWGHMIRKAPGGREAPWHQDEAYWESELDYHALGCWLPLHEVTEEMGAMQFVRGSHRRGVVDHVPLGGDVDMHLLVADVDDRSRRRRGVPLAEGWRDLPLPAHAPLHCPQRHRPATTGVADRVPARPDATRPPRRSTLGGRMAGGGPSGRDRSVPGRRRDGRRRGLIPTTPPGARTARRARRAWRPRAGVASPARRRAGSRRSRRRRWRGHRLVAASIPSASHAPSAPQNASPAPTVSTTSTRNGGARGGASRRRTTQPADRRRHHQRRHHRRAAAGSTRRRRWSAERARRPRPRSGPARRPSPRSAQMSTQRPAPG